MDEKHIKKSYKTKTRESLPIAVYNCGRQECEAGYSWGPAVRDHYLVHHVISGKGTFTVNEITHTVTAGNTFIIHPSLVASYQADQTDPWDYCWVGFNGADAKLLIEQTLFSKEKPVVDFGAHTAITRAVLDIYDATGPGVYSQTRAIGLLYVFLSLLMEYSPTPRSEHELSAMYVENAVRYITRNYAGDIDVEDIAASIGISRSHLYRVFVRHMGTSPNRYLSEFRIEQACVLLKNSSLPISAVANSVGFQDALYFSRVFKKTMNTSPSSFGDNETKN